MQQLNLITLSESKKILLAFMPVLLATLTEAENGCSGIDDSTAEGALKKIMCLSRQRRDLTNRPLCPGIDDSTAEGAHKKIMCLSRQRRDLTAEQRK